MYYTIYKTTNLINGKYYIGKHITKNPYDEYLGSNNHLKNAIKKYGINNFTKQILGIYEHEWQMNVAERILVVPDIKTNYNLNKGGHGGWSYIHTIMPKTHYQNAGKKGGSISGLIAYKNKTGIFNPLSKSKAHSSENQSKRCKNSKRNSGRIWITDGQKSLSIIKDSLDLWQQLGYHKGRVIKLRK